MKTKLLLLFLMLSFYTNAQITISNLTAKPLSSTSVEVKFLIQNNCSNIYYAIQYSLNTAFSPPSLSDTVLMSDCDTNPIEKTVQLSGLFANTTYYYRVVASPNANVYTNSTYSTTASVSTAITISGLSHQITNINSALISFDIQNNCTNADYEVQYSTAANFANSSFSTLVTMTDCSPTLVQKQHPSQD